jgi:hypothetical protein
LWFIVKILILGIGDKIFLLSEVLKGSSLCLVYKTNIFVKYNDAFSSSGYIWVLCRMIGRLMNNELENICKEVVEAYLRYYPSICLQGLNKTTKIPRSGLPDSAPKFEPETSRIRSRWVNHSAVMVISERK